ncbi:endonuclease, partial [Acholeplasma sp. OttesenSCG-928-E16]|nr:endonuclease [Acholeplasma sp. OttesenSCG-928-E16]
HGRVFTEIDAIVAKIDSKNIVEDITLPTESEYVSRAILYWSSDKKNIISNLGKVNRPATADEIVTMTLSVEIDSEIKKKDYKFTVLMTGEDGELKVIFYNYLNEEITSYIIEAGEKAYIPDSINTDIERFDFQGWYNSEDREDAFDFNKAITSTAKIYGSWFLDYSTYYNGYYKNQNLEGLINNELKNQLNVRLNSGYTKVSYGDARYVLEKSDVDLTNKDKLWGIYNSLLLSNVWNGDTMNREHVWPCARLGTSRPNNSTKAISSDLHNLRIIQPSINSKRSDLYFVDSKGDARIISEGASFYPGDEHKGDVARILFYMATMYSSLTLVNEKDIPNKQAYTPENAYMGDLAALLKWHVEDPVDEFEIQRNNVLFQHQKNRNPYIDYPELVDMIWKYYVA